MKRLLLTLAIFATLQLHAQTVLTPPGPTISPGSVAPVLSVSDVAGGTALTGPVVTNQVITNNGINELAPLLLNLETNLLQTLPVLAAFNDGFGFVNSSTGAQVPGAPSGGIAGTIPTNSGLAVPPVAVFPNSTNILGLPPGLSGLGTTNGSGTIVITRDSLRALLVLENDIERMLPILDAVNGGTNFIVVTNR